MRSASLPSRSSVDTIYGNSANGFRKAVSGFRHIILAGDKLDENALSLEQMLSDDVESGRDPDDLRSRQSGPNELFTICWTSGTESDPKGVPRTHNHWISIARVVVEGVLIEKGHNIHGTFPVINMAGIGGLMVPWVLTGGKFVLHHPFDVDVFMEQIMKEDLYYTLMPPALLDTLAKIGSGPGVCQDLHQGDRFRLGAPFSLDGEVLPGQARNQHCELLCVE